MRYSTHASPFFGQIACKIRLLEEASFRVMLARLLVTLLGFHAAGAQLPPPNRHPAAGALPLSSNPTSVPLRPLGGPRSARCSMPGCMLPTDVLEPKIFTSWKRHRTTNLRGVELAYSEGEVAWRPPIEVVSNLTLLPAIIGKAEISQMIALVDGLDLDTDPDSVDGMPSHEIMLSAQTKAHHPLAKDSNEDARAGVTHLTTNLQACRDECRICSACADPRRA